MNTHKTTQLTKRLVARVGAALLAIATLTTHAQTWDTFLPQPETENVGFQVLIDPFSVDPANPGVFIGYAPFVYGEGSTLRMEPVSASTYGVTVVDRNIDTVSRLGYNPTDRTLYAVGFRRQVTTAPFPQNNPFAWCVRKSNAGGAENTWTDADTFYLSSRERAEAKGFAADAAGNVYVCGRADFRNSSHWIVRKLPAGDANWQTVSDLGARNSGWAAGMCFYPGDRWGFQPAVFAVGIVNGNWMIQRLGENGTWTAVDSGVITGGGANSITYDNNGNLFVVGYRATSNGSGWVVRKSATGGGLGSWTTALDVSEGSYASAGGVTCDRDGNIWVSGFTWTSYDSSGTGRWTVMGHSPTELWSDSWNSRQHQFVGASYSRAWGSAADAFGNVFVTGQVANWTDGNGIFHPGYHIAVQRLSSSSIP